MKTYKQAIDTLAMDRYRSLMGGSHSFLDVGMIPDIYDVSRDKVHRDVQAGVEALFKAKAFHRSEKKR